MTEHPSGANPNETNGSDSSTHVREAIEAGLADSIAGRTIPVEQLRARFGLDP
jgi:hypothetical protein